MKKPSSPEPTSVSVCAATRSCCHCVSLDEAAVGAVRV